MESTVKKRVERERHETPEQHFNDKQATVKRIQSREKMGMVGCEFVSI